MNDLAFVIESWDEGTTDLEQVYRVAEEFVHGVSRMTVVAKIIHMEFKYLTFSFNFFYYDFILFYF